VRDIEVEQPGSEIAAIRQAPASDSTFGGKTTHRI